MAKKVRGEDGKLYKVRKPFYKKVWFWIVIVLIIAAIGGNMGEKKDHASPVKRETTTISNNKNENAESSTKQTEVEQEKTADEQYQAILDEYTQKIKVAAPKLVEEYNAEAPSNQGGLEGLAQLSNDKISKLAEISNDGISQMAKVHFKSGTGKYEDYETWASKLTDVYMAEAQAITDAYMNSAQ